MENAEILRREKSNESDWFAAPLFAGNVDPQINNPNAAPPINKLVPPFTARPNSEESDQSSLPLINVEPQKILDSAHPSVFSTAADLETVAGLAPERRGNSEASRQENLDSSGAEKPLLQLQKKSRKKLPVKKLRSQKRNVVPLKLFVSPAEKAELETRAKTQNCSLSNFIRLNLGLTLNEAGRKRQNVVAAFDISELGLDLDEDCSSGNT